MEHSDSNDNLYHTDPFNLQYLFADILAHFEAIWIHPLVVILLGLSHILSRNETVNHLLKISAGFSYLIYWHNDNSLIITTYITIALAILFNNTRQTVLKLLIPTSLILINEFFIFFKNINDCVRLRPIVMILVMKLTILNHDTKTTYIVAKVSYLLHPATILSGPVHTGFKGRIPLRKLRIYSCQLAAIILCLIYSCIAHWFAMLLLDTFSTFHNISYIGTFVVLYFEAQSFRFSHYFYCYLTNFCLSICEPKNISMQVIDLKGVEWPRSFNSIVACWNIPVHIWLKRYVFFEIFKLTEKKIIAILVTYTISSLLHGFKFHIWATLITTAFLAYSENCIRTRLSDILNLCVRSLPCPKSVTSNRCLLGHQEYGCLGRAINSLFTIYTIIMITYLGCIFGGDTDNESFTTPLNLWSELEYFGHWLAALQLILSLLL